MLKVVVTAILLIAAILPLEASISNRVYLPLVVNAPTATPTPTLVPTATPEPTATPLPTPSPYNVQAQNVVLQLGDMPQGYWLESSGPWQNDGLPTVSSAQTDFRTVSDIYSRPFEIISDVAVFADVPAAQNGFALLINSATDVGYKPASGFGSGDQSWHGIWQGNDNGMDYAVYYTQVRKGNVIVSIMSAGLIGAVDMDDNLLVDAMLRRVY
jgi:hypothetical protein